MKKLFRAVKRNRETGVSLTELLVYIGLSLVVLTMVVLVVANTVSSQQRFANVTTTQGEVNTAVNIMQRDLNLAHTLKAAGPNIISVQSRQDSRDFNVTIFRHVPGETQSVSGKARVDGIDTEATYSDLPDHPAIITVRQEVGTTTVGQDTVVEGVQPIENLFKYFNAENDVIEPNSTWNNSQLGAVKRVGFTIEAKAEGRGTNIQITSSATPAFANLPVMNDSTNNDVPGLTTIPDCPVNFTVSIAPMTQTAEMSWGLPEGATSYIIRRYNVSTSPTTVERTIEIANPGTRNYTDNSGLVWGATYAYTIQAVGPGGSSPECGRTNSTVVPEPTRFLNINPNQLNLNAVKANGSAETLSQNIPNVPMSSATGNIQAGQTYTVARGLRNQLTWRPVDGATGYLIYRNGGTTPIAEVSGSTNRWSDAPTSGSPAAFSANATPVPSTVAYGATNTYSVVPFNAGGANTLTRPEVSLVSPPLASTFGINTNDSGTASTNRNTLTLTNRGDNTVGYRVSRQTTLEADLSATECVNAPQDQVNGTWSSSTVTNTVDWGSVSCYIATPVNAAGEGVSTTLPRANQLPGPFSVSDTDSGTNRHIDTSENLWSTRCWVDPWGYTSRWCSANDPGGAAGAAGRTERWTTGIFGQDITETTDIATRFTRSAGAYKNYAATLVRTTGTSGNQGNPATKKDNHAYRSNAAITALYSSATPGSKYTYTVEATANNNRKRTASATPFWTTVDIPTFAHSTYSTLCAYGVAQRFEYTVARGVRNGSATTIYAGLSVVEDGTSTGGGLSAIGGSGYWESPTYYGAKYNYRYTQAHLNRDGQQSWSSLADATGRTYGACQTDWSGTWKNIPDSYPTYWAGGHGRYNSGQSGAITSKETSGYTKPPTAQPPKPDTSTPIPGQVNCSLILETTPEFEAANCVVGNGKPPAPTEFELTYDVATKHANATWSSVPGALHYNVYYRFNGEGAWAKTEQSQLNQLIAVPVDAGMVEVYVKTKNNATEGPATSTKVINVPAAPTGFNVEFLGEESKAQINWTPVTSAVKYNVYYRFNGTGAWQKQVVNGATTATTQLNVPATTTRIDAYMTAESTTAEGHATATRTVNIPPAPTGFAVLYNAETDKADLTWNAVPAATSYRILYRFNGTGPYTQVAASGTSHSLTLAADVTKVEAYVQSRNAEGTYGPVSPIRDATVLLQPQNVTATYSSISGQTSVTWNSVPDAARYRVSYRFNDTGNWTVQTTTSTNFNIPTSAAGITKVSVHIQGETSTGNPGRKSVLATDTILTAPTNLALAYNEDTGTVTSTWDAVTGAASYNMYYRYNGTGNYTKVAVTSGTSHVLTPPVNSTQVEVYVRAAKASGVEGAISPTETFVILAAPTNVSLTHNVNNNNLLVAWSAVPGAAKYKVYYRYNATGTYLTQVVNSGTSFALVVPNGSLNAQVYVTAMTANNNEGKRSNIANYSFARAPQDLGVEVEHIASTKLRGEQKVTLTWDTQPGITNYNVFVKYNNAANYTKHAVTTNKYVETLSGLGTNATENIDFYVTPAITPTNEGPASSVFTEFFGNFHTLEKPMNNGVPDTNQPLIWSANGVNDNNPRYTSANKNTKSIIGTTVTDFSGQTTGVPTEVKAFIAPYNGTFEERHSQYYDGIGMVLTSGQEMAHSWFNRTIAPAYDFYFVPFNENGNAGTPSKISRAIISPVYDINLAFDELLEDTVSVTWASDIPNEIVKEYKVKINVAGSPNEVQTITVPANERSASITLDSTILPAYVVSGMNIINATIEMVGKTDNDVAAATSANYVAYSTGYSFIGVPPKVESVSPGALSNNSIRINLVPSVASQSSTNPVRVIINYLDEADNPRTKTALRYNDGEQISIGSQVRTVTSISMQWYRSTDTFGGTSPTSGTSSYSTPIDISNGIAITRASLLPYLTPTVTSYTKSATIPILSVTRNSSYIPTIGLFGTTTFQLKLVTSGGKDISVGNTFSAASSNTGTVWFDDDAIARSQASNYLTFGPVQYTHAGRIKMTLPLDQRFIVSGSQTNILKRISAASGTAAYQAYALAPVTRMSDTKGTSWTVGANASNVNNVAFTTMNIPHRTNRVLDTIQAQMTYNAGAASTKSSNFTNATNFTVFGLAETGTQRCFPVSNCPY